MRNLDSIRTFSLLAALFGGMWMSAANAGPIDNLQPGQWYEFPNSRLETVLPNPLPEGVPNGMMGAGYSGGAYDTKRNRLIVFGGGHTSYTGNEVYVFDVSIGAWSRLTNPTPAGSNSPQSVHTYDQLEYLPSQDALFSAGGSTWEGWADRSTWLFNFSSNSWTKGVNMPGEAYEFFEYNMTTDYDPANDEIIMAGYTESGSYNPASNQWTLHGNNIQRDLGHTAALDPNRRKYVAIGRSTAYIFDVDAQGRLGSRQSLNASGATDIQSCNAPGLVFDPASDRLVAWCSGSEVYSLNLDNRVWTKHTATNSVSPGSPGSGGAYSGTFGRWRYMPDYNAFILATNSDKNVFVYKLSNGSGTAPATPAVSLSASSLTITAGSSSSLNWSSTNTSSCNASGGWSGAKAISGIQNIGPLSSTTTYTLTCSGSNGSDSQSVTITVSADSGSDSSSGDGTGAAGGISASDDWNQRASDPNVVMALNFDTQAEWLDHVWDNTGCNSNYAPGCRTNAWDQNVSASGGGSVRFDILSGSGPANAGNLAINFSEDYSQQFGENEEFWVQWRQRFDPFVIDHNYRNTSGNGDWKQVIIGQGDRNRTDGNGVIVANSCVESDLVVHHDGARDHPAMYTECGGYFGLQSTLSNGSITRQNQRSNCEWFPIGNSSGCMRYYPNEWMTFMVHVSLGPQGEAHSSASGQTDKGFINSTVEFYVAREGGTMELVHRQENTVITRGQHYNASVGSNPDNADDPGYSGGYGPNDAHPQAEIGKIWLTPFNTAKDPGESHQDASIWYDEIIVSRAAIPAPNGETTGGDTTGGDTTGGDTTGGDTTGGDTTGGDTTGGDTTGGNIGNNPDQPPATPDLSAFPSVLALWGQTIDTSAAYFDPDGASFDASEWQISRNSGFTDLVFSQRISGKTDANISAGILAPSSSYWVRTRHFDVTGAVSAWSEQRLFSTASTYPNDADGDGVDDAYQVSGFADANNNGITDVDEGICNLYDAQTFSIVGLESEQGDIQCFRSVSSASLDASARPGTTFPYGLFSFRIENLRADPAQPVTVSVKVHLPERPDGEIAWFKTGPGDSAPVEYAGNVTFDGNTAVIELTDGGAGDFDGIVNGTIVDPSGPAQVTPVLSSTLEQGSGGGSAFGIEMLALTAIAGFQRRRDRSRIQV